MPFLQVLELLALSSSDPFCVPVCAKDISPAVLKHAVLRGSNQTCSIIAARYPHFHVGFCMLFGVYFFLCMESLTF